MSGLAARSRTWADIRQTLISGNSIGNKLRLKCDFHGGLTSIGLQTSPAQEFQVQGQNDKARKCFCPTPTACVWERSSSPAQAAAGIATYKPNDRESSKIRNAVGGAKLKKVEVAASATKAKQGPVGTKQSRLNLLPQALGKPGITTALLPPPPLLSVELVLIGKPQGLSGGKKEKKNGESGCGRVFTCGHSCTKPSCNKDHVGYTCKEACDRVCNGGHKVRKLYARRSLGPS